MNGRLRKAVTAAMADDAQSPPRFSTAILLAASCLYGLAVRTRIALYRQGRLSTRRLPCKTISIGNIAVGGTGKTPMTLWLAARLREAGYRTAVLSRGYGGSAEKRIGVASDGKTVRMGPEAAGDEPFMMANRLPGVPVLVGRDRYATGMRAVEQFGSEVVLLDDGFQHVKLERDMDLVLLDGGRPLGNGRLLPRGTLREPPSALARADGIVLTRWASGAAVPDVLNRYAPSVPVFKSIHAPYPHLFLKAGRKAATVPNGIGSTFNPAALSQCRVMGFSGIARNDAFQETLRSLGAGMAGFMGFSDHHRYTDADIRLILSTARDRSADLLATTEKDWARLADRPPWPLDLLVMGVRFAPGQDGDALFRWVEKALANQEEL